MHSSNRYILCFLLALSGKAIAAEDYTPLLTYNCDPQADMVVVTNSMLRGEDGKAFRFSAADGTYSPWDMVSVDKSRSRPRVTPKSKVVRECELSSGVYTIVLEPYPFGEYLDGRCGNAISTAMTVSFDGIDILEKTAFEDFCHGNSPIIVRVTTFGKTAEVKIKKIPKYRFY